MGKGKEKGMEVEIDNHGHRIGVWVNKGLMINIHYGEGFYSTAKQVMSILAHFDRLHVKEIEYGDTDGCWSRGYSIEKKSGTEE